MATCHPFFLAGTGGSLFCVHHLPTSTPAIGHVMVAPAFNEEMNRCRSMVTQLALALAGCGIGTLVVDLHGTGDSAGEFGDARWHLWRDDLQTAWDWLSAQPGDRRALLGIRLGAILAAQCWSEWADASVPLLLWQPVADGKTHLTQFMRVKIAAQMDRPDLPKVSTATLRQELAAGHPIEVAGYALHPELCAALDRARLRAHAAPAGGRVLWVEAASGEERGLTPASRELLTHWPANTAHADARTFEGPAFWQVHERVLAPEAVSHTAAWLSALWRSA